MAIEKSITDRYGATHTASYTRISHILLKDNEAEVTVGIYHNAASRNDITKKILYTITAFIDESAFNTYFQDSVLDNDGVSPLKQAYAWLKTQTDFMEQNWTTGTTNV